jgi:hypothetical protein
MFEINIAEYIVDVIIVARLRFESGNVLAGCIDHARKVIRLSPDMSEVAIYDKSNDRFIVWEKIRTDPPGVCVKRKTTIVVFQVAPLEDPVFIKIPVKK